MIQQLAAAGLFLWAATLFALALYIGVALAWAVVLRAGRCFGFGGRRCDE